jgi:hypothetical protein
MLLSYWKPMVLLYIKNGFHLPLLGYLLYMLTSDSFVTVSVVLKLYSTNYFFWFCDRYTYVKKPYEKYNQLKQFVRLTDTGHLASMIYYFYPAFYPVAFNIHGFITIGYWTGKLLYDMPDSDSIIVSDSEYIVWINDAITHSIHGLPITMMIYRHFQSGSCYDFDLESVYYTYLWIYTWLISIYFPWRYFTGDAVYSVLDSNTSLRTMIGFVLLCFCIPFVTNSLGYAMNNVLCV